MLSKRVILAISASLGAFAQLASSKPATTRTPSDFNANLTSIILPVIFISSPSFRFGPVPVAGPSVLPQRTTLMADGCQVPSRIEGGLSFGQYMRRIRMNRSAGAGSQLDSLSFPGDLCWMYRSTESSALVLNSLRELTL